MKLSTFKRLATVSAIALGMSHYSGPAFAAAYEMDPAVPLTIPVTAAVDNTTDVAFTAVNFQNVGVTSDAVDTADLVMAPDGTITDDIGAGVGGTGEAHIVSDDNTGLAGQINLTVAFPNTTIFVYYSNLVNLTCALCAGGNPDLILEKVQDNLATPGSFTKSTSTSVTGKGVTAPGGTLTWDIGATIRTLATATRYETGAYAGSFDLVLTY